MSEDSNMEEQRYPVIVYYDTPVKSADTPVYSETYLMTDDEMKFFAISVFDGSGICTMKTCIRIGLANMGMKMPVTMSFNLSHIVHVRWPYEKFEFLKAVFDEFYEE